MPQMKTPDRFRCFYALLCLLVFIYNFGGYWILGRYLNVNNSTYEFRSIVIYLHIGLTIVFMLIIFLRAHKDWKHINKK